MPLSRRSFLRSGAGALAAVPFARLPGLAGGPPVAADATWLAGDLHCHTVYSHDVWTPADGPSEESYTWGWTPAEQIAIAESRGLDYLAITDHNRLDALHDPGYRSDRLTLLPGYEHSLPGGHAGVLVPGTDVLADVVGGEDDLVMWLASVEELGGIAILNHPFYGGSGLQWEPPLEVSRGFTAVEVWNAPWLTREEVTPFYEPDDHLAVRWWAEHFAAHGVAATGGSDNHWRAVTAAAGVGQPTTWVLADDRSPASVLDAIRRGRTSIAAQPPAFGGARLELTAREAWTDDEPATLGGSVRALGPLEVAVHVVQGTGQRLRLLADDRVIGTATVVAPDETVAFEGVLPPRGVLRAELYVDPGVAMSALTGAITARGTAPADVRREPSTGPVVGYDLPPGATPSGARLPRCPDCTHGTAGSHPSPASG